MSRSPRTFVALAIVAAALVFIVGALWPRSDAPATDAERTAQIASRIRCPFCNGESIAEATSQVARDLEDVIEEQVAAGMTDDEIFDFFADRYGESLLLDPPLFGWGWALWVLPLVGAALGVAAVLRRRRRASAGVSAGYVAGAGRLREQLAHVEADLAEVSGQLAAGEIDDDTGARLEAGLREEAAALAIALEERPGPEEPPTRTGRLDRRAVLGVAILLAGGLVVAVTLVLTTQDSSDGGIVDAPPIDVASITPDRLEEVVAANPDIVPMRLALARLLLEEGEVLRAAQHYGEVLAREPANPEALASLGWISFLVEEHTTAEGYLADALSVEPDYPQALWWLANVRMLGLADPAGAIEPLERLLERSDLPAEIRAGAEDMLAAARAER